MEEIILHVADKQCSNVTQILLMSDMAEFDDLRLELQKLKKKKQSTDILGKVPSLLLLPGPSTPTNALPPSIAPQVFLLAFQAWNLMLP